MGRMVTQPLLALLPEGAGEIAPGVGIVAGTGGGGLVTVQGLATFAGDGGDEAGRRLAAVQLVRVRAGSQGQVAAAFGVDPATVWRWDKALAVGGVAALVPARRGPKGASKLTAPLVARIAGLDAGGKDSGRSPPRPGCRRSASAAHWAGWRPASRPRPAAALSVAGSVPSRTRS